MSAAEMATLKKNPLTRGMRPGWPIGVAGLMTVMRVLPPDLYDKVVSGTGEVLPGAGGLPGAAPPKMGHMEHMEH